MSTMRTSPRSSPYLVAASLMPPIALLISCSATPGARPLSMGRENHRGQDKEAARRGTVHSLDEPITTGYEMTHGETYEDPVAPWVATYGLERGLDLDRVLAELFPSGVPSPQRDVRALVFSAQHVTGSWTYVSSNRVVLWELRRVRIEECEEEALLALVAEATPEEVIIDRFEARWRLALLDPDGRLLDQARFQTRLPHRIEGMWDVIATGLELDPGTPRVTINYGHAGGGGPRDQTFQVTFEAECRPLGLQLRRVVQTVDNCC